MNILSVAYPLFPVGPDSGGGAEQILFLVERELVRSGHRSIVIAAQGSQVSGELIETPAFNSEITDDVRAHAHRVHLDCIQEALRRYSIDLIHFHGMDFHAYLPDTKVPKLATLHLPAQWYPSRVFDLPGIELNCVSQAQADSAPAGRRLPVIFNGIDLERYCAPQGTRKFLLWIGRICPEKGVHIALRIAHRLDLPMVVAGPVHPFRDHQKYFSEEVQPLLDNQRRYAGAVSLEQKIELLADARCLLLPSLVAETSSLVAMEAISSGTPVVAYRAGALPEVVEHAQTGFIVDSEDEMLDAVDARSRDFSGDMPRQSARSFRCTPDGEGLPGSLSRHATEKLALNRPLRNLRLADARLRDSHSECLHRHTIRRSSSRTRGPREPDIR